jgi:hypothetical protein
MTGYLEQKFMGKKIKPLSPAEVPSADPNPEIQPDANPEPLSPEPPDFVPDRDPEETPPPQEIPNPDSTIADSFSQHLSLAPT